MVSQRQEKVEKAWDKLGQVRFVATNEKNNYRIELGQVGSS